MIQTGTFVSLIGVSTGMLEGKHDFASLLDFSPEVIEFYNYPSSSLPLIQEFTTRTGIRPALHIPVPYDSPEPLTRFAPTGPNLEEASAALQLALATVRCAASLNAMHAVVHFPSPYVEFEEIVTNEVADAFLGPLAAEAARLSVRVLVENLSAHPTFRLPSDYRRALDRHRSLGVCLDFGHAHALGPEWPIAQWIEAFGDRIESCHLYNARPGSSGKREPVHPSQDPRDGWMDIEHSVRLLRRVARPSVFVLEYGRLNAAQKRTALEGLQWLRGLLREESA